MQGIIGVPWTFQGVQSSGFCTLQNYPTRVAPQKTLPPCRGTVASHQGCQACTPKVVPLGFGILSRDTSSSLRRGLGNRDRCGLVRLISRARLLVEQSIAAIKKHACSSCMLIASACRSGKVTFLSRSSLPAWPRRRTGTLWWLRNLGRTSHRPSLAGSSASGSLDSAWKTKCCNSGNSLWNLMIPRMIVCRMWRAPTRQSLAPCPGDPQILVFLVITAHPRAPLDYIRAMFRPYCGNTLGV